MAKREMRGDDFVCSFKKDGMGGFKYTRQSDPAKKKKNMRRISTNKGRASRDLFSLVRFLDETNE